MFRKDAGIELLARMRNNAQYYNRATPRTVLGGLIFLVIVPILVHHQIVEGRVYFRLSKRQQHQPTNLITPPPLERFTKKKKMSH